MMGNGEMDMKLSEQEWEEVCELEMGFLGVLLSLCVDYGKVDKNGVVLVVFP